jgi:hypothetical protein
MIIAMLDNPSMGIILRTLPEFAKLEFSTDMTENLKLLLTKFRKKKKRGETPQVFLWTVALLTSDSGISCCVV